MNLTSLNSKVPSTVGGVHASQHPHYEFPSFSGNESTTALRAQPSRPWHLSGPISWCLTFKPTEPPLEGTYWIQQSVLDLFSVTVSKAGTTELASDAPALWVSAVRFGIDGFLAALMTSRPLQIKTV